MSDTGDTLHGARDEQLAELLGMAADDDVRPVRDETCIAIARALDEILDSPLPPTAEDTDQQPLFVQPGGDDPAGRPVGSLLFGGGSSAELLRQIKDYAKSLAASAESDCHRAAATAVYFAAICDAMIRCDMQITSHRQADLGEYFLNLAGRAWLPEGWQERFLRGRARCQREQ